MRIKRILVATDFSPPAAHAVSVATDLALQTGATLTVLHALVGPLGDYGAADCLPTRELEACTRRELDQAIAPTKQRLPSVTSLVLLGEPTMNILTVVDAMHIDLVVLGRQGRSWISRAVLGSVADSMMRASNVAVMTIPTPAYLATQARAR